MSDIYCGQTIIEITHFYPINYRGKDENNKRYEKLLYWNVQIYNKKNVRKLSAYPIISVIANLLEKIKL